MKTKHPILLSLLTLNSSLLTLHAAGPLRWTVETSRLAPAVFDVVRGETIDLEAALQSDGKPFAMDLESVSIFWQTNGMGNAWWTAPAAAESNRVSATFTPEMDPGASTVAGFLGSSGSIYRAAFQLRFRHGPGAVPNVIELPPRVLDLAHTVVINAPWPTDETIDARIRQVIDEGHIVAPVETNVVTGIISNTVTKSFVEDLGISGGGGGGGSVDTNAVRDIAREEIGPATNGLRRVDDMTVYGEVENTDWTWESDDEVLLAELNNGHVKPEFFQEDGFWYSFNTENFSTSYFEYGNSDDLIFGPALYISENDEHTAYATASRASATKIGPTGDHLAKESQVVPKTGGTFTSGDLQEPDTSLSVEAGNGESSVSVFAGDTSAALTVESTGSAILRVSGGYGDGELIVSGDTASIKKNGKEVATEEQVDEAKTAANEANVWSSAVYNFMTGGRTNCWFSGTNYVFGTDAAARTRFAWEDGMDAATVPCSMALWEIRDGERQIVWDQRDWTAWYWSFKASQMQADIQGRIDALGNAVTNDANYAWAKRYASDGTPNPDASTTFIDTPSVTLSPGMKWETVATVSGSAYWTIVGNGAVIGGSGTNAVLLIRDFEGNDIMTVTKGEHRLAWLEDGEIVGQMTDGDGWVCFDMLADAEPVGHFSTTLDSSDFIPQTDPNCPAQCSWEDIGGGKWRVHFLLKPGISANACFAKFQVEVEGQTVIRYNAGQEITGGLIYNGVRIAPDVSGTPAVGTVIQWKVVH